MSDTQNNSTADSEGIGYVLKQLLPDIMASGLGAGVATSGLVNMLGGSPLEALSYGAMAGGTASDTYQDYLKKLEDQQALQQYQSAQEAAYNPASFAQRQQEYRKQLQNNYNLQRQNYNRSLQQALGGNGANNGSVLSGYPYQRSRSVIGFGNY